MNGELVAQHVVYLAFFFALGACVGSFLNVVVWRLPREESLVSPPSRCPKCETKLAWYDNIPVLGWLMLRGKCRYCGQPISARYPIVEAAAGLMFAFYYYMFFVRQIGPCPPVTPAFPRFLEIGKDWPIFGLYLFALASLLASSLIDAELFIIPPQIPWLLTVIAIVVHGIVDAPTLPGALNLSSTTAAFALGATAGLLISMALWARGVIPTSFPQGEPLLDVDREAVAREIAEAKAKGEEVPPLPPPYTPNQIRMEMGKELLFLTPPLVLGLVVLAAVKMIPAVGGAWQTASSYHWLTGALGACFGAMIGALWVWGWRIAGTLAFGRVAMGLGDVHLMLGIGAVIGAGAVTVAFYVSPFFGILIALYFMITRTRRELPFGPYLSLGTAFVMLAYCPIAAYLTPGLQGIKALLFGQ